MTENKKFTKLINSDGTKQAVALDKVSFDEQTKKLTLYSSVDNSIKEETTIPASEVDTTLSKDGLAADAKVTGNAVKDVVKVGGTASSFTGIIVGTQEEEVELVEQKDFDAEIAKLNAKVGTPLVANTASAMVNTTKIYVYTGNESGYVNGNWYFYNGTNWESGGVYNAVAVQTDKTLTQENVPADAKKTGDEIEELKEDLSDVKQEFENLIVLHSSANIFNKNSVTSGYYFSPKNVSSSGVSVGDVVSLTAANLEYVPINGAGDYSWLNAKKLIGSGYSNVVLLYDESKNFLLKLTGTNDPNNDQITHFTITQEHLDAGSVYFGYSVHNSDLDSAMIVKSSTYPSEYIPYVEPYYVINGQIDEENIIGLDQKITSETQPISINVEAITAKLNNGIAPQDTTFIEYTEGSDNIFDKSTVEQGYYFALGGENVGAKITSSSNAIAYVAIDGAGDYSYLNALTTYGVNRAKNVVLFDSDKNYLSLITGTLDVDNNNVTHFSIAQTDISNGAVYIGYTVRNDNIDQAMVVKSAVYPSQYEPFREPIYELSELIKIQEGSLPVDGVDNPLYEKSVVFDGDSICRGSTTGGWAKYIGEANGMIWHNVGLSGGTITSGVYYEGGGARHWVSSYIDTIHTNHPTLDYLILEGGTNDADLLTDEQIGALDYANWTTFDDTTFIGALESLFYKAINYYPTAKIGFIIPQKMGMWTDAGYNAGDSPSTRKRRKFFEIAIQVCEKWGVPYIDLWNGSPLCPKLKCYYDKTLDADGNREAGKAYVDGQHLTQVGYNIISPKIEAWMRTL